MGSPNDRRPETPALLRPLVALIGSAQEWSSRALGSLLQAKGYDVLLAHTGESTKEQARISQPDLILLDTTLTDMDDLDLCRALRDDPLVAPQTPILTLSEGSPTKDQRLAALEAGASDILSSPLHAEDVYRKVDACIDAKRLGDEGSE